jgi:ABC-type multidrug transport system ATPase subunit
MTCWNWWILPTGDDMVDTLSPAPKQRLGLARVLIHDPGILVLDEPSSGLDPRARPRSANCCWRSRLGKTIIFSSHILAVSPNSAPAPASWKRETRGGRHARSTR